jgi:hypothetical protein
MSTQYPGGFITKSPVAPTSSAASGIWTVDQALQYVLAGTWPAPPVFIEDMFSTYLYTGSSATQTITNGIDLAGKGGMVWTKPRSFADVHVINDTSRGAGYLIFPNQTSASSLYSGTLTSFNSNGFSLGSDTLAELINTSPRTYASWTFAKQPKFFDVVTYTGTGANRTIAHSLGSVPGCIMVKRTDVSADWQVYHRSLANTQYAVLNSTAAAATGATRWNSTTPTSTVFSVGTDTTVNASAGTYVAYLFAHDAGGFPASGTGSTNGISCGTFTGGTVDLGYEPQWVMVKRTSSTGGIWYMADNMRGWPSLYTAVQTNTLSANAATAETATDFLGLNATGFTTNLSAGNYIYIAIRRGPMKPPTVGTSVFSPLARTGTGANTTITAGFPIDMMVYINSNRAWDTRNFFSDRLRNVPTTALTSTGTSAATSLAAAFQGIGVDSSTGVNVTADTANAVINRSGVPYINYFFGRAPGFFDVVLASRFNYDVPDMTGFVTHNLGVQPEMVILKATDTADSWFVYHASLSTPTKRYLNLNNTNAQSAVGSDYWAFNGTTGFRGRNMVGGSVATAADSVASYLFATVAGVSKVGSYTGTAALQTVNCGFTTGARYVLIKRTDTTGDWYSYDSSSGITSGNDPYMLLNSTAAQVTGTNYVDTDTTGFKVTAAAPAGLNAVGGTYIFLAIA